MQIYCYFTILNVYLVNYYYYYYYDYFIFVVNETQINALARQKILFQDLENGEEF